MCRKFYKPITVQWGFLGGSSGKEPNCDFPGNSVSKESTWKQKENEPACNEGDPVQFLGLEAPPGEGIDYPLQYSWASLVAQVVRNTPSIQETWFQSLGWENPLEEGMATHSRILA